MFTGFHVTRPTRKDDKGKAVQYVAGMTPREGASGVKASGKGEAVDLFVTPIKLPETITDEKLLAEVEKLAPLEGCATAEKR